MRISDWSSDVCSSDLFLNFAFDARDLITVWLVGHPSLAQTLERAPYAALHSRIQVQVKLKPVVERERFAAFIQHGLKAAGCPHTLLADSGIELLRQARSEEHTSELQSLMRISYAVFCLKKKKIYMCDVTRPVAQTVRS